VNEPSLTTADPGQSTAGESRPEPRELEAARDIAQAFLAANRPIEVYRLALARLTPLVDASFSSVFLRDPEDPELLKLVCAQNWPQASAKFLSQLRIRVGRGPTGKSVESGAAVEVEDLFADPSLREWWEPAKELGFASMTTLPLKVGGQVNGALSFYFDKPRQFSPEERRLLAVVAEQLGASAERADALDGVRSENTKLRKENERLRLKVGEAEEGQRLKTEFLSNMSHELRTPLTSILGHTFLLMSGQDGKLGTSQQKAIGKIDRAASALLRLINDLLELTHVNLGRSQVTYAPEDAVALAWRAAKGAGSPPKDVAFNIESANARVPLHTDGEKVSKILENLLSNAYKFTVQGQVAVTVGSEPESEGAPEMITWSVRDTGIGIKPEDQKAIFDEFRQVDGSSTRLYGGTGLGLALSLRLARLLGGNLSVQSTEGQGSTFTLRVPARGAS
jgi:signal transduction histidine kinase